MQKGGAVTYHLGVPHGLPDFRGGGAQQQDCFQEGFPNIQVWFAGFVSRQIQQLRGSPISLLRGKERATEREEIEPPINKTCPEFLSFPHIFPEIGGQGERDHEIEDQANLL